MMVVRMGPLRRLVASSPRVLSCLFRAIAPFTTIEISFTITMYVFQSVVLPNNS